MRDSSGAVAIDGGSPASAWADASPARLLEPIREKTGVAPRVVELDGIRAIAIAFVIACHYPAFAASLWGIPQFGWVGVEIFFVLSGYLITSILIRTKAGSQGLRKFYLRRAFRILPPYFFVVTGVWLLAIAFSGRLSRLDALKYGLFLESFENTPAILARIGNVLRDPSHNVLLWNKVALPLNYPGLVPPGLPGSLTHQCSVSVEEWFYLVWAPVVLLLSRRKAV